MIVKIRHVFFLISIILAITSCRKGKVLPETVYVHLNGIEKAGISPSPNGTFTPFNPLDFNEPIHYPSYVNSLDSSYLATSFLQDLTERLKKNNIILTSDTASYELLISLQVSEGLNRQSYVDSCSFMNTTSYVYYSNLSVNSYFTLKKNGVTLGDWTTNAYATEHVRSKTNSCNEPKIRSVFSGVSSLSDRVSNRVRVKVANEIYVAEGY